ncbi:hypothetical protein PoB_005887100 [Plakobranchus ocellatus]|uniref:Uncharacterized protein n=1 Tax=Plakobranchus ocellatus TaxID=259542 RepID=A0AAV4CAP9_9GAST|nr:hypothetical protein PoB_005887100 [Plakobranchus ocellatus]
MALNSPCKSRAIAAKPVGSTLKARRKTYECHVHHDIEDHDFGMDNFEFCIPSIEEVSFCVQPVYKKVIPGFRALRQATSPLAGLEPAMKGPCRSQGRYDIGCDTNAPIVLENMSIQFQIT